MPNFDDVWSLILFYARLIQRRDTEEIRKRGLEISSTELALKFDNIYGIANGTIPLPFIPPSIIKRDQEVALTIARRYTGLLARLITSDVKSDINGSLVVLPGRALRRGEHEPKFIWEIIDPLFDPIFGFLDGTLPIPVEDVSLSTAETLEFISGLQDRIVTWRYVTESHPELLIDPSNRKRESLKKRIKAGCGFDGCYIEITVAEIIEIWNAITED